MSSQSSVNVFQHFELKWGWAHIYVSFSMKGNLFFYNEFLSLLFFSYQLVRVWTFFSPRLIFCIWEHQLDDVLHTILTHLSAWGGCHGCDCMVVGFTTTYAITTNVASSNPAHSEVYNIMWLNLSATCGRSVVFSVYTGFLYK